MLLSSWVYGRLVTGEVKERNHSKNPSSPIHEANADMRAMYGRKGGKKVSSTLRDMPQIKTNGFKEVVKTSNFKKIKTGQTGFKSVCWQKVKTTTQSKNILFFDIDPVLLRLQEKETFPGRIGGGTVVRKL